MVHRRFWLKLLDRAWKERSVTLFTPVREGLNHEYHQIVIKLASKQRKLANAQKLKMSPHRTIAYDNL